MRAVDVFSQLLLAGLVTGSIYALVALGMNFVYKSTHALNFAQGEWVMLGGMFAAALHARLGMPLWVVVPASALSAALIGLATERLVIYPVRRPTPQLLTLLTIGIGICIKAGVMLTLGKAPAGLPSFPELVPVSIGGAAVPPQALWVLVVLALVVLATHLFFERTLLGRSMQAAAADRYAAELIGINTHRTVMWAFGLAALIGAIGGIIVTPLTLTSFAVGAILGFKGFSAAMLGGLGSLNGAVAGGLLLGVAESFAGGYLSTEYKDAVAFVLLLLVLFFRPSGLFGRAAIAKV